ncbi:MAG: glycosyltransferase [Pseudoflavonifractor sp.]|nr:glycosyltransferase [Pseudoflavonifractor sp.]
MSGVRLSVIVPVYNSERYLRECLDSLAAQPSPGMEVIVVDDGSRDGSGAIGDEFARRDSRFRVFHRENGGVSAARNFGLDKAEGAIVAFVDSDDRVAAGYYDGIIKGMGGCDLYCFASSWEYASGNKRLATLAERMSGKTDDVNEMVMILKEDNPEGINLLGFPWNKAFRRDIINGNQIRFNPSLSYKEDEIFVLEYLSHVRTMRLSDDVLYHYRILPDGLTSAMSRLSSRDWHELRVAGEKACRPLSGRGRLTDCLTYDMLNRMFMEAYCLYKEGGDWNGVMVEMCRRHDEARPGPVNGQGKVKLALRLRHRWFRRLFFAMLKKRRYQE